MTMLSNKRGASRLRSEASARHGVGGEMGNGRGDRTLECAGPAMAGRFWDCETCLARGKAAAVARLAFVAALQRCRGRTPERRLRNESFDNFDSFHIPKGKSWEAGERRRERRRQKAEGEKCGYLRLSADKCADMRIIGKKFVKGVERWREYGVGPRLPRFASLTFTLRF
jgi:hypothetical protein